MKVPVAVCIYYLAQEVFSPQAGNDNYFDQALTYIKEHGHKGLGAPELRALVSAAERRGRLDELEDAVIQGYRGGVQCQSTA